MSEETHGSYAQIFLYLLKEGGWHRAREVFSRVLVTSANRSAVMNQMCTAGYISKRVSEDGAVEYGVTKECRVPRFLSVGDLSEALF